MRQVLRAGALRRPRGMGWRGRWEGGSGWGTHVNPWLIHVNVWQKTLQYCNLISFQLIKINGKNKNKTHTHTHKKRTLSSHRWIGRQADRQIDRYALKCILSFKILPLEIVCIFMIVSTHHTLGTLGELPPNKFISHKACLLFTKVGFDQKQQHHPK